MSPEQCDPCVWNQAGTFWGNVAPSQQQAAWFVFCCYIATDAMFNFFVLFQLLIFLNKSFSELKNTSQLVRN